MPRRGTTQARRPILLAGLAVVAVGEMNWRCRRSLIGYCELEIQEGYSSVGILSSSLMNFNYGTLYGWKLSTGSGVATAVEVGTGKNCTHPPQNPCKACKSRDPKS